MIPLLISKYHRQGLLAIIILVMSWDCSAVIKSGAGIFTSATRTVFLSNERDKSIQVYNNNAYPVLIQLWVDKGINDSAELAKLPLMVIPPIIRLQPYEARAVRIIYTGAPLPTSDESIFWLNVQMIPPNYDASDIENSIFVSVRLRQKIFFRPESLQGGSDEWIDKLNCHVQTRSAEMITVACINPTHYFATLDKVVYYDKANQYQGEGDMLPPMGSMTFKLERLKASASIEEKKRHKIAIYPIDDQGLVKEILQ